MTREETIKWLKSLKTEIGKSEYRALWHYAKAIDMAIEALSADTVEVVRCKDCKHYKPFDKSKKFDCPQGLYAVFENDYCSHGERK